MTFVPSPLFENVWDEGGSQKEEGRAEGNLQ